MVSHCGTAYYKNAFSWLKLLSFNLMMLKENIVTVTNSNDFCAAQNT